MSEPGMPFCSYQFIVQVCAGTLCAIFDASQTKVVDGNVLHVTAWYDNEWGFSNRMCDTAVAIGKLL